MVFVTDTHTLIWFLTEDKKLGDLALEILSKADKGEETIIIPAMALAEIMYICEEKKVNLLFSQVLRKLEGNPNFIMSDLDIDTIVKAHELSKISEIHDRLIVATAIINNCPILTKDDNIVKSNYIKTIW